MSYPGPYSPQPPQGQPDYGSYQMSAPSKALAISALVVGVVALLTTWIPIVGLFALVLSVIAIILAIVALVMISRGRAAGRGMAWAGLVLGVISVIVCVVVHVLLFRAVGSAWDESTSSWSSMSESLSSTTTETSDPLASTAAPTDSQASTAPTSADPASEGASVTFGTPEVGGTASRLPVTVTNTGSDAAMFVIGVDAVKGSRVTSTSVVVTENIEPGASATEDAFGFVVSPSDLEGAQFQVSSISRMAAP